jgi:alkane 1-monooxygenase
MNGGTRAIDRASSGEARAWRPRRARYLVALLVPAIPFIGYALLRLTGFTFFWWSGWGGIFLVGTALDLLWPKDETNPPPSAEAALTEDRWYRWITYAYLPILLASMVFACWVWSSVDVGWFGCLGLALSIGTGSGIAINAAHELGHRRPVLERWWAKATLAPTAYGHFFVEHNRGHHLRVATPADPASARCGEGFWRFLPRTVAGSLRSSIALERERCTRAGRRFLSPGNEILQGWCMTVVLFTVLIAAFGWRVAPWLAVQALFGLSLLEVVNYVEHYGLLRERRADGRWEKVGAAHAWDASNSLTNAALLNLQRHSHHHRDPTKRYQVLQIGASPRLPTGYAGMIVLAWLPPLWRRVMDPRLSEHYGGDLTRAHLHPRQAARLAEAAAAQPAP